MKIIITLFLGVITLGCTGSSLTKISPKTITEKTINDTDDPAIWVNPNDVSKSIVFGTDKATNGAVYAFDLDGKIIKEKSILNIKRPNNVDVAYGFRLNDTLKTDILVFTEREKKQIRLFSVPELKPLDNGGFKVFQDANGEEKLPMGIALYNSAKSGKMYVIVGRKTGPSIGYLYQYELKSDSLGITSELVRKFGAFSGKKEIEAIAVDNELGYVYYSDEQYGIRKYYADPEKGDEEIATFGAEFFKEDIEGIAIAKYANGEGYILVSNQQAHTFNIFDRKTNSFVKEVNLGTIETDGCEVVTQSLGDKFPNGLFVSMNDEKNFFFHDLLKIIAPK